MVKVAASENLKKPMSAYFLWQNANREKIAAAAGGTNGGPAFSNKAAELWKSVSPTERKTFEDQHKQQKEKYEAYIKTPEGEAALKSLKEEKKEAKQDNLKKAVKKAANSVEKDEQLKRPTSAYWLWLNANREMIVKVLGSGKGSEVSKKGGELWGKLSAKEKEPFEKEAKEAKEKYEAYVKSAEGEAAMKAFKEAQAAAKAEVKGAKQLEPPAKKRKIAEQGA